MKTPFAIAYSLTLLAATSCDWTATPSSDTAASDDCDAPPSVLVGECSDLVVDWSGVTVDQDGAPFDPLDVTEVVVSELSMAAAEAEETLAACDLMQADVVGLETIEPSAGEVSVTVPLDTAHTYHVALHAGGAEVGQWLIGSDSSASLCTAELTPES